MSVTRPKVEQHEHPELADKLGGDTYKVKGDALDPTPTFLDNKRQDSIVEDAATHKLKLDGDEATPGNNQVYGTTGAGVKGWKDDPSAESTDGWITILDTLTYASPTTFTVSGDLTAKFQKGTKIKLTQTTIKYFYVVSSSYSSPNTTVTVTGGTDYSLANAAIATPFYSYQDNPQGFPDWFNWTPTPSASGSMTWTSVSIYFAKFAIKGRTVFISVSAVGTTGGTASTTLYLTAPVESKLAPTNNLGGASYCSDVGGAAQVSFSYVNSSTPDRLSFRLYDSRNWALGANSAVSGTFMYEME